MPALTKTLLLSSLLLPLIFSTVTDCSAKAKKRVSRSERADVGFVPTTGGPMAGRGVPKWVQYDRGGMYYYQRHEFEKARQYWLASLKIAEGVVPAERAKGLSKLTEQHCCGLLQHLMMMVTDTHLNPDKSERDAQNMGGGNPMKRQYDILALQLKKVREDGRWLDRVENFANRAIGKEASCMRNIHNTRNQMNIKIENTNYTMSRMEQELRLSQSSIDYRGVNKNPTNGVGPNAGLLPNGEYIPPGVNPTNPNNPNNPAP